MVKPIITELRLKEMLHLAVNYKDLAKQKSLKTVKDEVAEIDILEVISTYGVDIIGKALKINELFIPLTRKTNSGYSKLALTFSRNSYSQIEDVLSEVGTELSRASQALQSLGFDISELDLSSGIVPQKLDLVKEAEAGVLGVADSVEEADRTIGVLNSIHEGVDYKLSGEDVGLIDRILNSESGASQYGNLEMKWIDQVLGGDFEDVLRDFESTGDEIEALIMEQVKEMEDDKFFPMKEFQRSAAVGLLFNNVVKKSVDVSVEGQENEVVPELNLTVSEFDPDSDPDLDLDHDLVSDFDSDPDHDPDSDLDHDPDSDPDSDTDLDSDLESELDIEIDPPKAKVYKGRGRGHRVNWEEEALRAKREEIKENPRNALVGRSKIDTRGSKSLDLSKVNGMILYITDLECDININKFFNIDPKSRDLVKYHLAKAKEGLTGVATAIARGIEF